MPSPLRTPRALLLVLAILCILPLPQHPAQAASPQDQQPFPITDDGLPRATIVVGQDAPPVDHHAAAELAHYLKQLSGADLPIQTVTDTWPTDTHGPLIAIGTKNTNPVIAHLIATGSVRDPQQLLGYDAYVLSTALDDTRPLLALAGSTKASVLYPVYHLLEHEFGCGFFSDGERIPSRKTLSVPPQQLAQASRFAERHGVSPTTCGGWYTPGQLYSFDDWKQRVDWMIKHRLNHVVVQTDGQAKLITERARQRFRGEQPTFQVNNDAPPYYARQIEIQKQVLQYMRERGMVPIIWVEGGLDFKCELTINHPDTGAPDSTYSFSLSHPLHKQWYQLFIEEYTKEFGTDHYYGGVGEPYSEASFPEGEVFDDMLAASARYPLRSVKEIDPQAITSITGWPFLYWGSNVARMKGYMDNVGSNDFRVWDCGAARTETGNFYWGRPWVLGGVMYFGHDFTYFGDYIATFQSDQQLLANPRAQHCVGVLYNAEQIDYNPTVWEFFARASWNMDLDPQAFHQSYAKLRYGQDLAGVMTDVVQRIYRTCYQDGHHMIRFPPYLWDQKEGYSRWPAYSWYRKLNPTDKGLDAWPQGAVQMIEELENILDQMLSVADTPAAQTNDMFGRDFVDLLRQHIIVVFNRGMIQLHKAYDRGDIPAVRAIGDELLFLLDQQEQLVSSRPQYRMEWMAQHFATNPQQQQPILDALREHSFTHVQQDLLDYPRKDIFELIKFYYRPRFQWYLTELVACLEQGRQFPSADALHGPIFTKFDDTWKQHGYDRSQAIPFNGTMIEAVKQINTNVRHSAAYQRIVAEVKADAQAAATATDTP